jgi:hypothetical protein
MHLSGESFDPFGGIFRKSKLKIKCRPEYSPWRNTSNTLFKMVLTSKFHWVLDVLHPESAQFTDTEPVKVLHCLL